MYFFMSLPTYLCILKYMTLVSCNLVHVTLKVVWAEIPAVCFCVKYHTARLPEPHWGRPDRATGHLLTPPLEKTNSLTIKHLPSPQIHTHTHTHFYSPLRLYLFLLPLSQPLPTFIHCSFTWTVSCFPTSALSPKQWLPWCFCVSCCTQCATLRWQAMWEKQHTIWPFTLLTSLCLLVWHEASSLIQIGIFISTCTLIWLLQGLQWG